MGGEFDELAEALRRHGHATRDYVRVEQQIRDGLPTARRRRWRPLLAVLLLVLALPMVVVGRAHFVPAAATSGFPNASNTGIPAGTTLTAYTGPCVVTTPNTVITAKTVDCSPDNLAIHAANVQITNSFVKYGVMLDTSHPDNDGSWSFTVTDSEVDGGPYDLPAVCCGDMTVTRVNMHGGHNGAQCDGTGNSTRDATIDCLIQDSYIHDQYQPQGLGIDSHLGGFLTDGGAGAGIQLLHNTIICDAPLNEVGGGCTGDVNLIPNFGPINNVLIQNNFLGANINAPYCTLGGDKVGATWPTATNIRYLNNTFEKGVSGQCGEFGAWTNFGIGNTGNQWTGNKYDDGTAITIP